jgi:hypothetical protein
MFLITQKKEEENVLHFFQKQIEEIKTSVEVYKVRFFNDWFLYWASLKPSDNLHVFPDGVVIGKISFSERNAESPFYYEGPMPEEFHPLIHNVVIRFGETDFYVTPAQHSLVFFSEKSVSDYQLLIAKSENLFPDMLRVAVLGAVGYFPGNLSLFKEVKKISFLHRLEFIGKKETQVTSFELRKSDDRSLIERYEEISPEGVSSGLALSGGMDSRFVLGILLSKGIRPTAYSVLGDETDIVKEIVSRLDLEAFIGKDKVLMDYSYSIASDARIYFRGGNYSSLRHYFRKDEILHNGLFSGSAVSDLFKSAWKKPGSLKSIFDDLIDYALLSNTQSSISCLVKSVSKRELHEFLANELSFQKEYYDFSRKKQWAGWFFHVNQGLNWVNATMADTSYFTYPVYLLGDLKAVELGLSSSAYSNFCKERLRRMNKSLLSDILPMGYSDNRSFYSKPPIIRDFEKIYQEYFYRFIKLLKGRRQVIRGKGKKIINNISMEEHEGFSALFKQNLEQSFSDTMIPYNLKRTMITVNHTLKFLE